MEQVGKYEVMLFLAIIALLLLNSLGKPLCAACFFENRTISEELLHAKEVVGTIISEPQRHEKNIQALLETKQGKVLLSVDPYTFLAYGDRVSIRGRIQRPEAFGSFDYPAYLARQGIYIVSYYPKITVLAREDRPSFQTIVVAFKERLRRPILAYLPEPHAGLVLAMTLGEQWRLPASFQDAFARAGIVHVVSVSGLHITMISMGIFFLLIVAGFNRRSSFFILIPFLVCYIFLIGSSASAIRSGIMGGLTLLAYFSGRSAKMLYTLLLAALCILLWDVRWAGDIGFQLSFASFFGLILVLPELTKWANYLDQMYTLPYPFLVRAQKMAMPIILASLAVSLILLPLLAYHFGHFSLVAPLANILILPLTPLFLGLAFFVEISGLLWQPLWLITEYFVRTGFFFADLPFASLSLTFPSWAIVPYYALLLGVLFFINHYSFLAWRLRLHHEHTT